MSRHRIAIALVTASLPFSFAAAQSQLQLRSVSAASIDFASPEALAVLSNGSVVGVDVSAQSLIVIDSNGKLVRRMGRRGRGPFEFEVVSAVATIADTIVALDPVQRRLTFFGADGKGLKTLSIRDAAEPEQLYASSDGAVWVYAYDPRPGGTAKKVIQGQLAREPNKVVLRVSRDGKVARSAAPEDTQHVLRGMNCEDKVGVIYGVPNAIEPEGPMRAITTRGHLVAAERWMPLMTWFDLSRPNAAGRKTPFQELARPVTDAIWADMTSPLRAREEKNGPLTCSFRPVRIPQLPIVRALVPDEQGRVWALLQTRNDIAVAGFDESNGMFARYVLPHRQVPFGIAVRGNVLALMVKNDDDVPQVVTYTMSRE